MPIETRSTVSVFPPPVPPKEDVRPVIPTVYWQETPTRSRTPVFGRRQVDKLPAIKEESPEQSGNILTQAEEDILRQAGIEFKKDIDGITARTILAAARNTVGTSVSGLYHNRQTHRVRSHLWDWIEVVTTNLSEIKRSSTIVGRSHQQVRDLLEHLKAVETILLQWQFEDLERPVWTEDLFHRSLLQGIVTVKNALHDPSNLIDTRVPQEIEVLRRLINAERYYRQHLNRSYITNQ